MSSKILTFGGYALTVGNHAVGASVLNPYVPLPAGTLRLRFKDGYTPVPTVDYGSTLTQVSSSPNVWDWTQDDANNWDDCWKNNTSLLEIVAGNLSGVSLMSNSFYRCTSLQSVALMDTSNIDYMINMFYGCTSLKAVPLFDTSNAASIDKMFYNCYKVESGALALYQKASENPPLTYAQAFHNCGRDTATGSAELAQIPADWK